MGHQSATGRTLDRLDLAQAVDNTLLKVLSPVAMVVTGDFRVLELRGDMKRFGFPSTLSRVPRGPLGSAIRRLVAKGSPAEETIEGTSIAVVRVEGPEPAAPLFCVVLRLSEESAAQRVKELERTLSAAREYLATVLDEYGSATEELRSAYEELKTANEELHRLNDELSNANQDLNALNTRLESRSRDLQRVNAELAGVLSSVGIPMLLLDRQLRICRFTPLAGRLLHIDASDVNRPVAEAWLPPGVPEFEEICRAVLDTFVPQFRPIVFAKRSFSLVVRPYRMENNQVAGVLVALMENPSSVSPVIV